MGLPKGRTNNPSGRKRGSKNERTKAWEHLGEFLTDEGAIRAKEIIMNSNDAQFMIHSMQLVEYFKPKQQANNHSLDKDAKIIVTTAKPPKRED